MSYRGVAVCIISIAQQARPNVAGQIDDDRAQLEGAIELRRQQPRDKRIFLGGLGEVAEVAVDRRVGTGCALDRRTGRRNQRHSRAPFRQM